MKVNNVSDKSTGLPKGTFWTPLDQALMTIKGRLVSTGRKTVLQTCDGTGYILSRSIFAGRDSPPLPNSAVDGYAFKFPKKSSDRVVKIVPQVVLPGNSSDYQLLEGTAAKIFTGAPMPSGADTVILREDVEEASAEFEIPVSLSKGSNMRQAGEDKKTGDFLFSKGHRLKDQDLALLISTGILDVEVYEKLNVGVLSTGDELTWLKKQANSFEIFDSNRPMLISKLKGWGCNVFDLGIISDNSNDLKKKIGSNIGKLDLILTSGGASSGDRDCVSQLLNSEGDLVLWRVAIKPGRPFIMGFIDKIPVFGLPGNPVAAFVCALVFLKPSLDFLSGGIFQKPKIFNLKSNFIKTKKAGRTEFLRARTNKDGEVEVFGSEGSGRVSGLSWSEGLVQLGDDVTSVEIGSSVEYLPYELF